MGRYRHKVYEKSTTPRWIAVFGLQWQVIECDTQGLPYLKYVLSESQVATILSPHGVVMVRVPVPERYAIHKLMVSQLRGTSNAKVAKDLRQAATLIDAVVERFPGAINDALSAVPKGAGRYLRRAMPALKQLLPASAEAAWDALQSKN